LALILSGMMDVQHLQDRSKNDDEAGAKVTIRITITAQVSTNDWHDNTGEEAAGVARWAGTADE